MISANSGARPGTCGHGVLRNRLRSGTLANKYSTAVTLNASPDAVLAAAADILQRDFRVRVSPGPGGVSGSTGVSMLSWGEKLSVSVDGAGPQGTSVTVRSASVMPLQFIDYGRNRRNVEKLAGQLSGRLAPGAAAPSGPPGTPGQ